MVVAHNLCEAASNVGERAGLYDNAARNGEAGWSRMALADHYVSAPGPQKTFPSTACCPAAPRFEGFQETETIFEAHASDVSSCGFPAPSETTASTVWIVGGTGRPVNRTECRAMGAAPRSFPALPLSAASPCAIVRSREKGLRICCQPKKLCPKPSSS